MSKSFGHVCALDAVSLSIAAHEVVALVGDNGAGKSTLVKILTGDIEPTSGELRIDGEAVRLSSPSAARARGIEVVHQDLAIVPSLDAAGNFFLGREMTRTSWLSRRLAFMNFRAMRRELEERFRELDLPLEKPRLAVEELSGGQRQLIAVARALGWPARVVILDEPTAALGVQRAARVAKLVERAAEMGAATVVVSHDIPRMFEIATRIVVLRLGRVVLDAPRPELRHEDVIGAMVGVVGETTRGPNGGGAA